MRQIVAKTMKGKIYQTEANVFEEKERYLQMIYIYF